MTSVIIGKYKATLIILLTRHLKRRQLCSQPWKTINTIEDWINEKVFDELISARKAVSELQPKIKDLIARYNLNTLATSEVSAGKTDYSLKDLMKTWDIDSYCIR